MMLVRLILVGVTAFVLIQLALQPLRATLENMLTMTQVLEEAQR